MKYLIPLFFLLLATPVQAQTVAPGCSIDWDYADPMPENVDGFRLYNDDVKVWEGVNHPVPCADFFMEDGRNTLKVTAYNAADESLRSNPLTFVYVTSAPDAPTVLRMIIVPID